MTGACYFANAADHDRVYHLRSMNGMGAGVPVRKFRTELIVMAAAALLFAALGPFGSFDHPVGKRLADWLLFAVGGYLCFRPIIAAGDALSTQTGLHRLVAIALACVVAALPTTLLVVWVLARTSWSAVTAGDLAGLYPKVLLVGAVVTGCQLAFRRQAEEPGLPSEAVMEPTLTVQQPEDGADKKTASETPASPAPSPSTRFLDQLPAALGRDLLCLENEDHYVRAHTPNGSTLILMRMRDAVADLAEIEGARVHRSWWVARRAVSEVIRRDRAVMLRLVDGREVPVARSMVPELRAAGWLNGA